MSTSQHTSWRGHVSVRDNCQTRHLHTVLKISSGLRMVSVQTAYLKSDSKDNSDQRSSWPQSSVSVDCQWRHLHTGHCLQDPSELHTTAVVACGGDSNHNDQHKLAGKHKSFCVGDDRSRHLHTSRVSGVRPNCMLAATRRRRHQSIAAASTSKLELII